MCWYTLVCRRCDMTNKPKKSESGKLFDTIWADHHDPEKQAKKRAEKEADHRGGKYGYNIFRIYPNGSTPTLIKYSER